MKPRMMSQLSLLVTLFVVFFVSSSGAEQRGSNIFQATLTDLNPKTPEVSTQELVKILAEKSAVVFDVRPRMEYAISHIPGVFNVSPKPGVPMSAYVSDVVEIGRLLGNNKSTSIVVYCGGPFCGKSRRVADELLAAGYTNIRRYQLGIPVWRALGGLTEIELEGLEYVLEGDRTAVFVDVRGSEEFRAGSIPRARNIPFDELKKAKDDGRLPMEDHNTRIIVFGRDGTQARSVAEAITREAFHNVSYVGLTFEELKRWVGRKTASD